MKKIVSFALMLAVLLTCVIVPVSADTAENASYFEPSYADTNWTVTKSDDATNSISAEKGVYFHGGIATAVYNPGVMKGDFIMTAEIGSVGSGAGNKMKINVAGSVFTFCGNGTVGIDDWTSTDKYKRSDDTFAFRIEYKSVGKISLYCINSSGKMTLAKTLSEEKYANKNGNGDFSISEEYVQWTSVKNIKMYKPLTETYVNTFDDSAALNDLNDATLGNVLNGRMELANQNTTAFFKKYTTGSYCLSMNMYSVTNNKKNIYFNYSGANDLYALNIANCKTFTLIRATAAGETPAGTKLGTYTLENKNLGADPKISICYNSENGGIYVFVDDQLIIKSVDPQDSGKSGLFGVQFWWQQEWQTLIDNLSLAPTTDDFTVENPTVSVKDAKVTGTASAVNFTGAEKKAVVITAIYNGNTLADVKAEIVTIPNESRTTLKAECDGYAEGYTAKCFVFDSLDTVTPLATAANYPEGN